MLQLHQLTNPIAAPHAAPDDHVYVVARRLHHHATCSCGFQGKRRLMLASATLDALMHAAQARHYPASLFEDSAMPDNALVRPH